PQIHEARVEALKKENFKDENLYSMDKEFENRLDETLCIRRRNEPLAIPLDEIHIDDKLNFIKEPDEIMDREVKRLKQIRIPIMKVRWNSRRWPEFT
ncbi:hypothetical protein Tco_1545436, partial [Tanacetum coccineum]